jgi:hypothetical protein
MIGMRRAKVFFILLPYQRSSQSTPHVWYPVSRSILNVMPCERSSNAKPTSLVCGQKGNFHLEK